jgi:hypothetical protein
MKVGWWGSKWVASPPSDPKPEQGNNQEGGLVGSFPSSAVDLAVFSGLLSHKAHQPTNPPSRQIQCSAVDLEVGSPTHLQQTAHLPVPGGANTGVELANHPQVESCAPVQRRGLRRRFFIGATPRAGSLLPGMGASARWQP